MLIISLSIQLDVNKALYNEMVPSYTGVAQYSHLR